MATTILRVDDKSDGFTVEFTVSNTYRRTFEPRPADREAMAYAREQVTVLVPGVVETPTGVIVQTQVIPEIKEPVIDLPATPAPAPAPSPGPGRPAPSSTRRS